MHIDRLDARNDGCDEKTARAGGRTHTQRTWSIPALEDAEELLLLLLLARDADLRRAAAARPVHARDLGRRQGPGVAPHLLVVREAVLLRAGREVVAALGAAAPVEGLAEDADVGLRVEVGLVLVRHLLDVGLAVVEGRHAEARLYPALLALELLPLLGRHARGHVGLELRGRAHGGRGGLEGGGGRERKRDDDGLHGVFFLPLGLYANA